MRNLVRGLSAFVMFVCLLVGALHTPAPPSDHGHGTIAPSLSFDFTIPIAVTVGLVALVAFALSFVRTSPRPAELPRARVVRT